MPLRRTFDSQKYDSYLRIGEVSKLVGISASVIRSWETVGLTSPRRTASKYRLYTQEDVRVLKRAKFMRKVHGLNASAIRQLLRSTGVVKHSPDGAARAIGVRLRQLRIHRGLSLTTVAKAINVTPTFLSALERSHTSAPVGTLRKLTEYFESSILEFFDPSEQNTHLVRPDRRKVLEAGTGVRMELLAWGNTVMEPHLFRITPKASSGESYKHEGEEFLFVLRGELRMLLDGEEYRIRTGDSFYFESSTPHRWSNPGRTEAWVLWINTPPTF
jgi:DNA-binding transcriptional MerR regulator/quercetin dioxygenase-like cupin family protein